MRSERTRECIKKRWRYQFLSWFLCFGVFMFLMIYGFATKWSGETSEAASHIKALLLLGVLSILPILVLSILVKDKIKPTVRMLNVILSAYLVANWFMYITGALMLIDAYLITYLVEKYKTATIANKEMDKRDESDSI